MNSRKEWHKWIDDLNDDELLLLFDNKQSPVYVPENLNKKMLNEIIIRLSRKYHDIKEKKQENPIFRFLFKTIPAITALIIVFYSANLYINYIKNSNTVILDTGGEVFLTYKNGSKKQLKQNDRLTGSQVISTGKESFTDFSLNKRHKISIRENSEIHIVNQFKDGPQEKTVIYIKKGFCRFELKKITEGSSFLVETGTIKLTVVGTVFSLNVTDDITSIGVAKGSVKINLVNDLDEKINELKSVRSDLASKIYNIINQNIEVSDGGTFEISGTDLKNKNKIISGLIDEIKENPAEKSKEALNRINKIYEIMRQIYENKNQIDSIKTPDNEDKNFKTENSRIIIHSPQNCYYESPPVLKFEAINLDKIKIFINDEASDIQNGYFLPGLHTGFNTVKISAMNADGREVDSKIDFFLNDLNLSLKDDFNRKIIKNDFWEIWGNTELLSIKNNRLAVSNTDGTNKYVAMRKSYNYILDKKIIEKISIIDIGHSRHKNIKLELGVQYENDKSIQAILVNSPDDEESFRLKILVWQKSGEEKTLAQTENFPLDFSSPAGLVFYKDGNIFYAILIDDKNRILKSIYSEDKIAWGYDHIKLGLFSDDYSIAIPYNIVCDDFYFYYNNK